MGEMIAYCGLKCHECPLYIATKANDKERIEELSRKYSTEEQAYAPGDLWCDGCIEKDGRLFAWCRDCRIWLCATEKHVVNCAHCGEFPCEIIEKDPSDAKGRLIALKKEL